MNASAQTAKPVAAVGIVCVRDDDVLLVRRGSPPLEGRWTLPGGRLEWGERAVDAALRELMEETGCAAEIIGLVDVVDGLITNSGPGTDGDLIAHYVLIDYAARWTDGEPRGGDDASDARFFSRAEIEALGLWSETLRVIAAGRAMVASRAG